MDARTCKKAFLFCSNEKAIRAIRVIRADLAIQAELSELS